MNRQEGDPDKKPAGDLSAAKSASRDNQIDWGGFRAVEDEIPPGLIQVDEDRSGSGGQLARHHAAQHRNLLNTGTHVTAKETIDRWIAVHEAQRPAERESVETHPEKTALVGTDTSTPGSLIGTPVAALSQTPLEDLRRQSGLHLERADIYDALTEQMDLREGMRMLDRWTRDHAGCYCRTMDQMRRRFPDLTSVEVAFLPLLADVPETFVSESAGYDAVAGLRSIHGASYGKGRGLSNDDLKALPQMFEFRTDGISFGTDTTELTSVEERSKTNPTNKEIVAWTPEVSEMIQRLVVLTIESPRLFDRVRDNANDALSVGIGLIRQEALRQVEREGTATSTEISVARPAQEGLSRPIEYQVEDLLSERSEAFKAAEQQVVSQLIDAKITFSDGRPVEFLELVHVIGILNDIPSALLQNEPFKGSLHFYGDRVLITDEDEIIRDEAHLDDQCKAMLKEGLFDEAEESSQVNPTMAEIQFQLMTRVQTKLFSDLIAGSPSPAEKSERLSLIEAVAFDVHERHGVTFHVLGEHTIDSLSEHLGEHIHDGLVDTSTLKFGFQEAEELAAVLDRVPAELRPGVKAIKKKQIVEPGKEAVAVRQLASVSFDASDGVVTIKETAGLSYSTLGEAGRNERSFLLAYACGEALWQTLSSTQQNRWEQYYRAPELADNVKERLGAATSEADLVVLAGDALRERPRGPHRSNCLTEHGMIDRRAKFCSSFACFVLSNNDFRDAGTNNRVIKEMYQHIEGIFKERLGHVPDYSSHSLPLALTTSALTGEFKGLARTFDSDNLMEQLKKELQQAGSEDRNEEEEEDVDHETGNVTDQERKEQLARDKLELEVEAIIGSLFEGLEELELADDLVADLCDILEKDDGEDAYDEVEQILRNYPEVENDSDDPLEDLWEGLVDYGLVTDFEEE